MDVKGELLPVDYIISDVLVRCDDEATRKGLTKGFYINLVNQALDKLAMTSFYNEEPPMDVPMPTNLRWQLPTNFFNIQQLYAFNGDCCTPTSSTNIYFKRNFNNAPNGQGYTALNTANNQGYPDPYFWYWDYNIDGGDANNLLFANVQNGFLMFSSACVGYSNFRVIYNGFGGVIGDKPMIPRPLREVVIDLVVKEAFEIMQVRNPKSVYGALIDRAKDNLYNKATGSWWQAQIFVRQSDNWKKNMREIYAGVGNY
jgi:hypothetical protein